MTAPERFADSQISLAPRAPSIHDPSQAAAVEGDRHRERPARYVAQAHFRAASAALKQSLRGVRIIGFFIARRVPEAADFGEFEL